ncbi:MAG: bifunctional folylpolyglutamate synthase/dihydrofolate synthase [Planctomycetota bacterium]
MSSGSIDTFDEAVGFLAQGINYEKTRRWKYNTRYLNLSRMEALLEAIGNPHDEYRVLHVAGTKGKGSTAGAAADLLHRAGRRVGLLTSPHLVTPRERIRVDGGMIEESEFVRSVRRMRPHVERKREEETGADRAPTYFEMLTALAFDAFAERRVDWAVVEVGLGGRLDSTNVVAPTCCVITTIGFDHMSKLGHTAEAIATEKAGILKPGVPVVLGRQQYPEALETLRRIAGERDCPRREVGRELRLLKPRPLRAPRRDPDAPVGWQFGLRTPAAEYRDLVTPLLGAHQLDNLAAAVGAAELAAECTGLELTPEVVAASVAAYGVPGRVEVLQRGPALVLDVAHTVESIRALLEALATHFPERRVLLVFGCSRDKNVSGMLEVLKQRCGGFTATQAENPRAMPAEEVAEAARGLGFDADVPGGVISTPDPVAAVDNALQAAGPADIVCLTGSFYTAGEVRAAWCERHSEAAL